MLSEIELEGANGAAMPGQNILQHHAAQEHDLPDKDFTRFRALAARANYLASDRIDIIYASTEICRFMAKPTDLAMGR